MSHQDSDRHTVSVAHHQDLKNTLDWLLASARLSDLKFRQDCSWTATGLIFLAVLWAWSDEKALTQRFFVARKAVMAMGILQRIPAATYQAFLKILATWTIVLATRLVEAFHQRMQSDLAERFHIHGFAVFGVDGSRLELPRTKSHECIFRPRSRVERRNPRPIASSGPARKRPTARKCG